MLCSPSSLGRETEISDIERMKFKKMNALHCGNFERSAGEEQMLEGIANINKKIYRSGD